MESASPLGVFARPLAAIMRPLPWTRTVPGLVFVAGLLLMSVFMALAALGGQVGTALWENGHRTIAASMAFLAAALSVREALGVERRVRVSLALALGIVLVGQLLRDVQLVYGAMVDSPPWEVLLVGAAVAAAGGIVLAVRGRTTRGEELALYIDSLLLLVVLSLVFFALPVATGGLPGQLSMALSVALLASAVSWLMGTLVLRGEASFKGGYGVAGGLALLGVSLAVRIAPASQGQPSLSDLLFSVAVVVVAIGAITWRVKQSDDRMYRVVARAIRGVLPAMALIASLLVLVATPRTWGQIGPVEATAGIAMGLGLLRHFVLLQDQARVLARERDHAEGEHHAREDAEAALRTEKDEHRRYRGTVDTFNRLAERITFAAEDPDLISAARVALSRLVPTKGGNILLMNPSHDRLIVGAAWGPGAAAEGTLAAIDRPVRCPGISRGSPYQVRDASDELSPGCPAHPTTSGSVLCVPLLALGQIVGVVHLERSEPDGFDAQAQYQAGRIAEQTALALVNARLVNTMESLAMRDPLTGLHNARFFDPYLDRELASARRTGQPLGLVLLDLDAFKHFNDTHGHPAGDLALKTFADTVLEAVRESDTVARYGGEEFVIAVPGADLTSTMRLAEKVRNGVAQMVVEVGPGRYARMTVSGGVANTSVHGYDRLQIMRTADKALYRAKGQGRNCVMAPEGTEHIDVRPPGLVAATPNALPRGRSSRLASTRESEPEIVSPDA